MSALLPPRHFIGALSTRHPSPWHVGLRGPKPTPGPPCRTAGRILLCFETFQKHSHFVTNRDLWAPGVTTLRTKTDGANANLKGGGIFLLKWPYAMQTGSTPTPQLHWLMGSSFPSSTARRPVSFSVLPTSPNLPRSLVTHLEYLPAQSLFLKQFILTVSC